MKLERLRAELRSRWPKLHRRYYDQREQEEPEVTMMIRCVYCNDIVKEDDIEGHKCEASKQQVEAECRRCGRSVSKMEAGICAACVGLCELRPCSRKKVSWRRFCSRHHELI